MQALQILKPQASKSARAGWCGQATNARWALALWRQHCRVLRVAPLRRGGAKLGVRPKPVGSAFCMSVLRSESPFLLRTVLRVWRVHLQEKRQRRVAWHRHLRAIGRRKSAG